MNKKSLSVLIIGAFLVGISGMAYAMMCNTGSGSGHGDAHAETTEKGSAVNVGNEICPVGGEAVDGMTTYEYKGKIYNFCCPMCIDEFKKNPEKYSAKAKQAAGSEHSMQESYQHAH